MLWAQIRGISSLSFSVLWRGSGDLLWHSGTSQLFRIISINSQISSPYLLPRTISCTAPVRKYCNAQYPIFCSCFTFLFPFLTGHTVFYVFCQPTTLLPLSVLLCLCISLCSTSLLAFHGHLHSLSCLPSLLVCYAFLFTKRGILWESWNNCRLRYFLNWCLDTVSLLNICQHLQFSKSHTLLHSTPLKFPYTLKIFFMYTHSCFAPFSFWNTASCIQICS